jgi:hypothetical protein
VARRATLSQITLPVVASDNADPVPLGQMSDAFATRAPNAHATSHGLGQSDQLSLDATQLTSGAVNLARLPVASSGTSSTTALVRADDSRLADARTPTTHASRHATGGADPLTPANIGAVATSAIGASNGIAPLDANGRLLIADMADAPVASLFAGAGQSLVNNTWTAVLFNNETVDTHNAHSTTANTSRFVVPVTGVYWVVGQPYFGPFSGGVRACALYKNGASIVGCVARSMTISEAGGFSLPITACLSLVAGDYIELFALHTNGSTQANGLYASSPYTSTLLVSFLR